jgi:hypothetical protein
MCGERRVLARVEKWFGSYRPGHGEKNAAEQKHESGDQPNQRRDDQTGKTFDQEGTQAQDAAGAASRLCGWRGSTVRIWPGWIPAHFPSSPLRRRTGRAMRAARSPRL